MLPRIKIDFLAGQLGTVGESPDGLLALVCGATAVEDKFELNKPYSIHSYEDAVSLGLAQQNNPRLLKHIVDFYDEAPSGTRLIIFGVDKTKTFTELCDKNTGDIKTLIESLNGALRGVIVAGEARQATATTNGLDEDVVTALPKAQLLAEWATQTLFAPLFVAIEARGFTGENMKNLRAENYNRVAVVIGDTTTNSEGSAVGIFAGRIARIPVQRNIARVKDGALRPLEMYIGEKKVDQAQSLVSDLYDSGYIAPRKYVGKAGYFFTDDCLACVSTDDYAHLAHRRVIDKAYRIAYNTLLNYMLDELEVNEDGTLNHAVIVAWQQSVETALNRAMTAQGELSSDAQGAGCACYINPKQNVLATSTLNLTLKVRPFGYARFINVDLGFQVKQQ